MKKLLAAVGVAALTVVIGLLVVNMAFAQTDTPSAQAAPTTPQENRFWGGKIFGFGGRGGSFTDFDAIAEALNLTPTELFEQLHSGKTLDEIATAQGVDLAKVQEAAQASRLQAMKDKIAQAVKDGKMTQEQADWLLQGLDKGYLPGGKGFGFAGRGDMRGMRGGGMKEAPSSAPDTTPAPGTSS